ncbi:MAG: hypothetical protein HPY45_02250 [Anaerolineae bacterium]|nr:hypothetical protein [Anaerolineae bacterium]
MMSDFSSRVLSEQDFLRKILSKIPGFSGYIERQNRRASDKLLRDFIAARFEEQWKRISALQRDLVSNGQIDLVDDLEQAAVKLRQFIDRVKNASYGYASFFDNIKVNEEELAAVYQYDLSLLDKVDEVARAVDNVETSMGTDGLKAAIRQLTTLAQDCVDAFNKRSEAMKGLGKE